MNTYELITKKITDALEQGVCPWRKPWVYRQQYGTQSPFVSHTTGRGYSFLNEMLLVTQGKEPGEFITFNQAKAAGGSIKKGAKSALITFYTHGYTRKATKEEKEITGCDKITCEYDTPILKWYQVFHINDTIGIEPKHAIIEKPEPIITDDQRITAAEIILQDYYGREGAPTLETRYSDRAYYRPLADSVTLPLFGQFETPAEYYSTAFHETTHSTGHESRLNRKFGTKFQKEDYSREELVAEIGAAFLCSVAGIESDTAFNNSIAYLQGWAKYLADKPKAFAIAAAQAEKAVNLILGKQ